MKDKSPKVREFTLPDGKKAVIRAPKVKDLIIAQKKVGQNASPQEGAIALLSETLEIDGKKLSYEDFLEMDLAYVAVIIEEQNKFYSEIEVFFSPP